MAKSYMDCAALYAHRCKNGDGKRISRNQRLYYDEHRDCYQHKHHNTITVEIFRDHYMLNTGGWDTSTTWSKMHEFALFNVSNRPSSLFVDSKFITWDGANGRCYTPFYDGIKVNYFGTPLDPEPCEVRRTIPGARADFYAMVKKVRAAVVVRMLVGEFDDAQHAALDDRETYELMREVAARSEGLFAEYLPYDLIAPLFAQREQRAFGRRVRGWDENKMSSPKCRFNSSINAAKRAWESEYSTDELYETVKRSFT